MCDVGVVFIWFLMVRMDWCGDSIIFIKLGWFFVSIWIFEKKIGIFIEYDLIVIEVSNVWVFCIMFF